MFGRVAIIGVGLIGGSLALALKRAGAVKTITGCGRSTIEQAKSLGIIDEATTDIAAAVKDADIVVICTPLSTYRSLTEQIAPHLKPGAILTDVGSVKTQPAQDIRDMLSPAQRPFFVPGHPIAGTEKSGPEAAFAELFEERKVLLTPEATVSRHALEQVKAMWKVTGAQVETINIHEHDAMYAHVSHVVQVLCSAYGVMLVRQKAALPKDETFHRFIRLCGSDAVMWRDVFAANRIPVLACIDDFLRRWEILQHSADTLTEYVGREKEKREKLKQNLASVPLPHAQPPLQLLVAATLVDSLEKKEYTHVIGGGFRGFTRNLLSYDGAAINIDAAGMAAYAAVLNEFRAAIVSGANDKVEKLLNEGKGAYQPL